MPLIEGAGVPLAYQEHGAGAAVLLVHDLAADAAVLHDVVQALAADARVIAYDRRGYGDSGAPEPYEGTTVEEQAEDAAALLRGLDARPAWVAGEGFGALIALDLAKRHGAFVRGLALAEPPLLMFVAEATRALAAERASIERAVREDGPQAGVAAWLAARGGERDDAALARARAAYRAFFADYAGLASWPVTRAELRALSLPAVVLTARSSPQPLMAAADALAALLPDAQRAMDGDLAAAVRSLMS